MSLAGEQQFADWKERAVAVGLLATAQMFGAKLRKAGAEYIGPCCACGGTDRLAIHVTKNKWHCRGHGGGESPITLAMHIGTLSWKEAAERLAGPCPSGPARPLSDAELAERNRARLANEATQRAREAQETARQDDTREAALAIWNASRPFEGTLAQTYLFNRGIPLFECESLRFHPALPYPKKPKPYPALVCRVDALDGSLCAVWRIFLRADGRKADVEAAKLGLGPAGGGAVRLGGIGPKVGIAEGLESALGFWFLTGRKYPVLAALSTSGMIGIELPLNVERVVIAPDGDAPIKKHGHEYLPTVPAGRKAAEALRARLLGEGIGVTIAAEPGARRDYLDLWNEHQREVA